MEYIDEGYDTLIVRGDYEGNSEAIAEVLNGLSFDQDGAWDPVFEVHEGYPVFEVHEGNIDTDRIEVENASAAFPRRAWYTSEDGRRLPANKVDELSDEGVEWHFDHYEEPSLEDLSRAIAPLMTRGTLELVSIRHDENGKIQLESLAIRSDGWAQRESQEFEIVIELHECSTETYGKGTRNSSKPPLIERMNEFWEQSAGDDSAVISFNEQQIRVIYGAGPGNLDRGIGGVSA